MLRLTTASVQAASQLSAVESRHNAVAHTNPICRPDLPGRLGLPINVPWPFFIYSLALDETFHFVRASQDQLVVLERSLTHS